MPGDVTYDQVHEQLAAAVPSFAAAVEEHQRDYGEVLPHLLFGDLTRFVLQASERGDTETVDRSLLFLSKAIQSSDMRVENLVAVSFVENVGPRDPSVAAFIESWPAPLRAEAPRQRDWRPDE
jgi:hypothetical protein